MARPHKPRCIGTPPKANLFKPMGIPVSDLEVVTLSLDELEAIRLADLHGDQHEHAAAKMNISRPTFGRILEHARKIVADAITNGKGLLIEGGSVTTTQRGQVSCGRCHQAWEVPIPAAEGFSCPRCAPTMRRTTAFHEPPVPGDL